MVGVSCGTSHTLVMAEGEEGTTVYAFGSGIYGQLGTGSSRNSYTPARVKIEGAEAVAAGESHSLFLREGEVLGCGDNSNGQLGAHLGKKFVAEPNRYFFPDRGYKREHG